MSYLSEGHRGLLMSLIVCCAAVLPFLVTHGWPEWTVGLVWIFWGGVRAWKGDDGVWTDCAIFFLLNLKEFGLRLWNSLEEEVVGFGTSDSRPHIITLVTTLSLAAIALSFPHGPRIVKGDMEIPDALRETWTKFDIEHPDPCLFPCRTTHARIFPKRHAFGYTYLLYGIPITPEFLTADGIGFRWNADSKMGNWWMQVRAEDHLERGLGSAGFYTKLKLSLRERGVEDSDWSYAYLITAPRFFGYSFNPVSFWYIYDRCSRLKYMILEVNNTFGERRIYLLNGSSPPTPPQSPGESQVDQKPDFKRFTDHWEKDFHVSPFNSRKGSYALKALDPFPTPKSAHAKVDNTITLKSSKDHAKIVARVYSTGPPLDVRTLNACNTARFIIGWWWVGFLTFPRILKEAFKLFFQRSLHVWFRPEVMPSSIGRAPTNTEMYDLTNAKKSAADNS